MNRLLSALVCVLFTQLPCLLAQEASGPALPDGALARVGSIQLRHQSTVHQLAFLPDGTLAALDVQGHFCVWDPATGHERRSFSLKTEVVPDQFDEMRRMEMMMRMNRRGMGGRRFRGKGEMEFAPAMANQVFSADGRRIAAIEGDNVLVRDTTAGKVVRQFALRVPDREERMKFGMRGGFGGRFGGNEMGFQPIGLSPDGQFLAAGSGMGNPTPTIQLYDLPSGKELHALRVPMQHPVMRIVFLPGGTHLAGVSMDQVLIWDLKTGKRVRTYQGLREGISAFAVSPDGKKLATAGEEGSVSFWEEGSEEETGQIPSGGGGGVRSISSMIFSADGKTILAGCFDNQIRLFDVATNKESKTLAGHDAVVCALALSNDGKTAASADMLGRIKIWDLAKGKETIQTGHSGQVVFAALGASGAVILGGQDGGVRHIEIPSGKILRSFKGPGGETMLPMMMPLFSPDGKTALLANNSEERGGGYSRLWDVEAGKELRKLKGTPHATMAAFSSDGKRLALVEGEEYTLQLWDLASGELVAPIGTMYSTADFTRDGGTLVGFRHDGQAAVIETATAKVRLRFPGPGRGFRSGDISPDGRQLAAASGDVIRLWSLKTGKVQQALAGHPSEITSMVYSSDGKRLASGGADGSVRVWDLAKGNSTHVFAGHRDQVRCLAFASGGKVLVSGSNDGTALIWDLETPLLETGMLDPEAKKLDALWEKLAKEDAEVAFAVQNTLAEQPAAAVVFLRKVLSPAGSASSEQLTKLIAELSGRRFAAREKAMAELEALGGQAEAALRKALAAKPELEVSTRIEQLLEKLKKPSIGNSLRLVRAVELLEQIGTAESRKLLEELAGGAAEARLTLEAKGALKRLPPPSK